MSEMEAIIRLAERIDDNKQSIVEKKQSIVDVMDLVVKVSDGLYELTKIVHKILEEK